MLPSLAQWATGLIDNSLGAAGTNPADDAALGLGVAAGPLIGGAVVDGLRWNAIFWLNVPVGFFAVPLVIAPLAGMLAPRIGTRALMVGGLALQAIGLTWFGLSMGPDTAYGVLVPAFIACGVGMGLVFAPISTAVLATMRPEHHAKASGTNSTVREIGVALGIAVLTAVFTGSGGEFTPSAYSDAASPAVFTGAAMLVIATIAAMFLPAGRGTGSFEGDLAEGPAALAAPREDLLVMA